VNHLFCKRQTKTKNKLLIFRRNQFQSRDRAE
jgi:hypothetical protein